MLPYFSLDPSMVSTKSTSFEARSVELDVYVGYICERKQYWAILIVST